MDAKFCLANWNWLGRHEPLLRDNTLGHQLLLAIGQVVSTKVYLPIQGKDQGVRQAQTSWRQKFLQSWMRSFLPSLEVMQDCFVVVFTGPDKPTQEDTVAMEGRTAEAPQKGEEMARKALRREVELHLEKKNFDPQARLLLDTNYVYMKAHCCTDLVEKLPQEPAVPEVFHACAECVSVDAAMDDVSKANGPVSATTAGEQERDAASDESMLGSTPWLSVLDDDQAQISSLLALDALLEQMERQERRVVANEVKAMLTEGGYGALDELGRKKLLKICDDFYDQCRKVRREDELAALWDRIRCLENANRTKRIHRRTLKERRKRRTTRRTMRGPRRTAHARKTASPNKKLNFACRRHAKRSPGSTTRIGRTLFPRSSATAIALGAIKWSPAR